jgi:hypothetical protein
LPQIVVEADELFKGVLTDLGEVINYIPNGEDPILSIFDYVEAMRCQLWEIAFFNELGGDNGAHKNNPPDEQLFFVQAVRRVLYIYFRYVLLPRKAISKVPIFFLTIWILKVQIPCLVQQLSKHGIPFSFSSADGIWTAH